MSVRNRKAEILPWVCVCLVVAAGYFLAGCEKKSGRPVVAEPAAPDSPPDQPVSAEPRQYDPKPNEPVIQQANEPADLQEPDEPSEKPIEPVVNDGPRLIDVVRTARTWGMAFTNWYGQTAPDFNLTDINGKNHTLSDYRGRDVMVVFWATWCGPCRYEIPHLMQLRRTTSEDNLAILAISREDPKLVKYFAERQNLNYTVLHNTEGMPAPYNTVNSIPSSFFIDSQGKIKLATAGVLTLNDMQAILRAR